MIRATIDEYYVRNYGGPNGIIVNGAGLRAIVFLSGENIFARIYFICEGFDVPENSELNNQPTLYMPESQLPNIIDILRNEGPVNIYSNAPTAYLYTGSENVGEGEL